MSSGVLGPGGWEDGQVSTSRRSAPREVVILGSTGSIGTQALDVVRATPGSFRVLALTAGGASPDLFAAQCDEFRPAFRGLGEDASAEAASMACDVVLNGITGAVGLRPVSYTHLRAHETD